MAIKVNKNAKADFIKQEVEKIVNDITINAKNGFAITEIFTPKETSQEVRRTISKMFDEDGTEYDWMIVRKGINSYTGRPQYFSGETIGDMKRYKLKIYNS